MKEKYLIVDSFNLATASRYAMPDLTYGSIFTGAIYGFIRDVANISSLMNCTRVIFCWDAGSDPRRQIFPEYKLKRREKRLATETPEDKAAFDSYMLLKNSIIPDLGFANNIWCKGYEADDVIASIVMNWKDHFSEKPVVLSSDEDLYQLLRHCDLWQRSKTRLFTEEIFRDMYKITPEEWILVKSIGGCSSDEVPSVAPHIVGTERALSYIRGELNHTKPQWWYITSLLGQKRRERNLQLVKLPFPGCVIPEKPEPDRLAMEKYAKVCTKYGLYSLLAEPLGEQFIRLINCGTESGCTQVSP